jgi:hypothetical protein
MQLTDFHQNVQGLVYAIDLASLKQDPLRTVNLNALIDELAPPKRFVAVPNDIAFAPNSDFGYYTSLASDSLQRVDYSMGTIVAGSPSGANFLQAGKSPTGVAIVEKTAYVVNEVGRSISVIDLATQTTRIADLESAPQPTNPTEAEILKGQRFFDTGLARWSANGWVSCASCHPSGTTDNVTWSFPTGPRQSSDLTATFNRDGGVQRILNWTAIFDEVHDFELNTRGVANGTGAIVSDATLNMDGTPNVAARIDIVGPGGTADPQNAFNKGSAAAAAAGGATPDDWDAVEAYIRSLRAPRGRSNLGGDPVAGRAVFLDGNCQFCHGGPLWTLSERYYTPLLDSRREPGDAGGRGRGERRRGPAGPGVVDGHEHVDGHPERRERGAAPPHVRGPRGRDVRRRRAWRARRRGDPPERHAGAGYRRLQRAVAARDGDGGAVPAQRGGGDARGAAEQHVQRPPDGWQPGVRAVGDGQGGPDRVHPVDRRQHRDHPGADGAEVLPDRLLAAEGLITTRVRDPGAGCRARES